MIIHAPQLVRGPRVRMTAQIEWEGRRVSRSIPKALWFEFPAEFESELHLSGAPFVVALLLLAMQQGEAMEVRAPVSKKLLQGLQHYQRIFNEWYPERFHLVEIRALGEAPVPSLRGVEAAAFSGGVDSFFTFLDLRNQGKLPARALFMAGFDMPLNLGRSIRELTQSYQELMKQWGVGWVDGATNVRAFVDTVDWTNAHGTALAASALCFQGAWSRFYIPSSYTLGRYPKWGTHPELDPWLSSEALEFVHQGAGLNRVRKLEVISRAPESFARLRVCWIQDIGLKNCGRCEKCVRTQAALEVLGAASRYSTFAEAFSLGKLRKLALRTASARLFAREMIREALGRGKGAIALSLVIALGKRRIFRIQHRLFSFFR